MKRIALFLLLLFSAAITLGQEVDPLPVQTLNADQLEFKPPMSELLNALVRSGLRNASTNVFLAYDENGTVTAVKLDKTTRSKLLDSAILSWAARIKVKAQQSGIGSLPISFDVH